MPDYLCVMSTITEAIDIISSLPGVALDSLQVSTASLKDYALQSYIEGQGALSVFDLCFVPLISNLPSDDIKYKAFKQALLLFEWFNIGAEGQTVNAQDGSHSNNQLDPCMPTN